MALTVKFSEHTAGASATLGGKAVNLGRLSKAGFRVPPGFTVTTEAYTAFLDASALRPKLLGLAAEIDFDDVDDLEKRTRLIRDLILGADIPPEIAAAVSAEYAALGADDYVAVRSSGTAEDLAEASFAGLHDTYLDIRGLDGVLDAVRRCWASMWTSRATAYRHQQGFDQSESMIAVVVQAMVPAQVSGVMFTGNPMTTATDELVINASWGLGEAIVSGAVTPDEFVVAHGDLRIKERTAGDKRIRVVRRLDAGSGVMTEEITDGRRSAPCLSDEQVAEIAELGRRVQAFYDGLPQDIEWAFNDGLFYLLQSRPITGVEFSWDADCDSWLTPPEDDDTVWTRAMADEAWTGAITPLMYTWRGPSWVRGQEYNAPLWGFPEMNKLRFFKFHKAEVYYNANLHRMMVNKTAHPVVRAGLVTMLPESWRETELNAPFSSRDYLRMLARVQALEPKYGLHAWMRDFYQLVEDNEDWYNGRPPEELHRFSDAELRRYIDEFIEFECRFNEIYWTGYWIYARDMMSLVGWMVAKWYTGDNRDAFIDMVSGSTERTATAIENGELWELAERIRASTTLSDLFRTHEGRDFFDALDSSEEGRRFFAQYREFATRHGHRGMADRDIFFPRRIEDPSIDYQAFRAMLSVESPVHPEIMEKTVNDRRVAVTEDVLTNIRRSPFGALKAEALKYALDYSHKFIAIRDNERYLIDRGCMAIKNGFLEVARRLVERGVIGNTDEVFFLTVDEAYGHLAGRGNVILSRAKIAGRMRDWHRVDRKEEVPAPYLVRGRGVDLDTPVDDGDSLRGVGTARGVITGTARVIKSLNEIGRLTSDDILICNSTDPGWTPVFSVVRGLVLETGGRLAHGSCLAREFGLPAVQIGAAMQRIPDGATITIDGNAGRVTIVEEAEAACSAR